MKPNDNNAKLPPEQRPFRVLIFPALTEDNTIAPVLTVNPGC